MDGTNRMGFGRGPLQTAGTEYKNTANFGKSRSNWSMPLARYNTDTVYTVETYVLYTSVPGNIFTAPIDTEYTKPSIVVEVMVSSSQVYKP